MADDFEAVRRLLCGGCKGGGCGGRRAGRVELEGGYLGD